MRRRQGLAAAPVGGGRHCTRYVAMHPLRGATPDQNGCNAYGSGAMPTDRVHRTTLEYPKKSLPPRTHHPQTGTHEATRPPSTAGVEGAGEPGGRERGTPWAAAGPSRASRRRAEPHNTTPPHWCGGRRGAWLRRPWAAGPGRASSRRIKPHASTPSPTGVKGAGGPGGHGRASRRGAERSEDA